MSRSGSDSGLLYQLRERGNATRPRHDDGMLVCFRPSTTANNPRMTPPNYPGRRAKIEIGAPFPPTCGCENDVHGCGLTGCLERAMNAFTPMWSLHITAGGVTEGLVSLLGRQGGP